MRIDGVDLSHWQPGKLDFAKAKAAGVLWVTHKVTEGGHYADPYYARRRAEVKAAGILFGAYHFARPAASSGTAQAHKMLTVAKPVVGEMLPLLDLEDTGGLNKAQLTRWTLDFAAEVRRVLGCDIIIYTPFDLGPEVAKYTLWVARYNDAMKPPKVPAPWNTWDIWQFSNGVHGVPKTVPGIGACDINTIAGANPAAFLAKLVITPRAAPQKPPAKPAPVKKPAKQPATNVSDARTKLEAAVKVALKDGNARRAAAIRTALDVLPMR